MNDTAVLIAIAYSAVVVVGLALAVLVAVSTRSRRSLDAEKAAHRERNWLFVAVAILAALLAATIWAVPYGEGGDTGDDAVVVNVAARQFGWQIKPAQFPAGHPVEFRLVSDDVNHGFGIYDADGSYVAQVQVVPGKTQVLVHTFERPGRYEILCLEFCGVGHHRMTGAFEVTG